jgi:hypothetical protein
MTNDTPATKYREAADKVWEIGKEYERAGHKELGMAIKELSSKLHNLARKKEAAEKTD